jgi:hypothetical protein
MPERFCVRTQWGAYDLEALVVRAGPDWLVWIWGGSRPHIGAVAMAQPRPSLKDPRAWSATASVFSYVGHKEGILAQEAAERLAAALRANVVVAAGVHWDNLGPEGIAAILERARALVTLVEARMRSPQGEGQGAGNRGGNG